MITALANGRYTVKNALSGNFVYVSDRPGVGTQVVGKGTSRERRIQGTGVTNRFTYVRGLLALDKMFHFALDQHRPI